ncbi:MAG: amidohydrolase [Rhodospirillales bacterium]|nr:amidohydrolase [Rhodospirillales bacterium]
MIVDLEHHFRLPREDAGAQVSRRWTEDGQVEYSQGNSGADIGEHLSFMDEAGIDMAVLSGNLENAPLDTVKMWNDACARAVSDHPARLAGFACTLPLGGEPAFDELERAIKELGMKGVHINARPGGLCLDSRELWPFYEKVAELDVPIDVHVETLPDGYDVLHAPWILYYVLAREFDITQQVFRLCFGGVLEDFPGLKIIVNHFGGGVSAIKERMDYYVGLFEGDVYPGDPLISRPWQEYFDQLYFNMAGRGPGLASVKCALTCIAPEKLLFGSDWPPNFENDPAALRAYIDDIRSLDLADDQIEGMLGGNAARLLALSLH